MTSPTASEFHEAVTRGEHPPLRTRIPADLETPVSAYLKLKSQGAAFLLESVVQGQQRGRYSFIGVGPCTEIRHTGNEIVTITPDGVRNTTAGDEDVFAPLRKILHTTSEGLPADVPGPFGGAVGVIAYDIVRHFEPIALPQATEAYEDDYRFLVPTTLAVFDHVKSEIELLVLPQGETDGDYTRAELRIKELLLTLESPLPHPERPAGKTPVTAATGNVSAEEFEAMVRRAQEHIAAGDTFQIVLSQRLNGETPAEPFQIYRALRILNPSPYLYFIDFGDQQIIGSSPEVLVSKEGRDVAVNPIAGTRPRSDQADVDHQLEVELLNDTKERAEHVMLVDLGRNDLGRVCETGSVRTPSFMTVEKYSHVMHIVSRVCGRLRTDCDAFDLLRATFPAGTVTGAPKIRAMQLISAIEGCRRGPYAGAVGYFGAHGDLDFCIGIRTLFMRGRRYYVQAGAGIVADSQPAAEYQETLNKIQALARAVAIAEEGI